MEETLQFAFQCKSGGTIFQDSEIVQTDEAKAALERANKADLVTKLVLAVLGLSEVKDTFVGDTNVRGVSGGQRRRVTVGEMMTSRCPVLCGDEISTGLDAASTYDMVQMILHFGRLRKFTRIISLLQPSPETVSLFNEVIVLAEGKILYCGPVLEVEEYFADIGYKAPDFMDIADFLQMISTGDVATLYDPPEDIKAQRPDAPTIEELAELFQVSQFGTAITDELSRSPSYIWHGSDANKLDSKKGEIAAVSGLSEMKSVQRRFANRFPRSTYLVLMRFLTLWTRDRRVIVAGAVKNILMGVSVGGVFWDTDDPISIQGVLFQGGLFIMLGMFTCTCRCSCSVSLQAPPYFRTRSVLGGRRDAVVNGLG